MKLFIVRVKHIATSIVWHVPVLADSLEDAQRKAGDWPFVNDGYIVIRGESK
jgi:hypothetical protein